MTVCQYQLTTMISFKISGKLLLRPVEQVTRQRFLMELIPVTPSAGSAAEWECYRHSYKEYKLGNRAGEVSW